MIAKYKPLLIALAALLVLICIGVTFKLWLESHDSALRTFYEMKELKAKADALEQERDSIKAKFYALAAEKQAERNRAQTPVQQAEYVSGYVHIPMALKPSENETEPPQVTFPQSELPRFADYVAGAEIAKVQLAGCKAEVGNLTSQVKNRDEQIATLSKSKNATTRSKLKWFGKGIVTGLGVAAIALHFL